MRAYILWCNGAVHKADHLAKPLDSVFHEIARLVAHDELPKEVGTTEAMLEPIRVEGGELWCDEEGLVRERKNNEVASRLVFPKWGTGIVGTAVLRLASPYMFARMGSVWCVLHENTIEEVKGLVWPGEAGGGVVETKLPRRKAPKKKP